ncbi:hypothetical protein [Endozoicomonas sp. SCSIO W0465]|uniref:hypothetical protein n=1 Tax=Endozoicomonas sp. SCSIO W0465 TaxID=2918516 RepID=UPI0020762984|nr:hypothetical protein [Endozoicomonas sp. SCSIO W0465]USE35464.1 hypothetical protein MJO57_25750 [Endozoicomonas sp. SCSIO W0465]
MEALASSNRSNLNGRLQPGSLAFGLPIEVAVPSNYVNYSSFFDQSFYNPFTDSRFKKVPVRVIFSQQHDQNETSGVGQSTLHNSSVFDNNLHLSLEISNQDCIDPVSGPRASVAIIKSQLGGCPRIA